MTNKRRTYENDVVSVSFDADKCTHAALCVKGLPEVFDVNKRPWINVEGADPDAIIDQVKKCPSGALQYKDLRQKDK